MKSGSVSEYYREKLKYSMKWFIKKTTQAVVVAAPEVLLEEGLAASPRHVLDQHLRHHRLSQAPLHPTVLKTV